MQASMFVEKIGNDREWNLDKHRSKCRLSMAGVGLFRQSLEGRSITLASCGFLLPPFKSFQSSDMAVKPSNTL